MKIGTQNQAFFPENILEKFRYIKEMGFDGFEIDGKLLVNNLEEVKAAIKETGLPVTTACGGYDGWIGDFIEERRLNGLKQIERILEALAEVGGKGIVVPAAWGMFTFRLPPMTSPRSLDGDRKMVSDSLRVLEQVAARTGTVVYLEPLNRYQDHMINTLADARRYIVENDLKHVQIIGDFYHMNTLMALEAGCHVMCEKPPAMTPEQAREMCDTARKLGKVLAYDFHHRFALDTQQLRDQVTNGVLGEIYVTTARALRRCGVPGWGVFTNKELQGGGPLIDIGIHMLDAAMYVLGFPAVKSVNAHSFQKIGTQKSCGQFGEWDPATYSVEDSLFGTIEFHNGGILWLETSFALNIREQSIMNVSFCGDKAGATLFPAHIYTDNNGELMTLMQREMADDNRHLRSMEAFINHVQGKPVMIADAEQGYIIQQLVAALYQSAETGTRVEL
ncbi:TPA: TIM barrel protein [Escherichia coli]|nr:TIM barrel protein [Escherichia coli]HAZ7430560.1 TIM barrel protein [Escherichia coli]